MGLLVSLALLIGLVCGWGGVLLALADLEADRGKGRPSLSHRGLWRRRAAVGAGLRRAARGAGRALSALIEVGQGVPTLLGVVGEHDQLARGRGSLSMISRSLARR